MGEDNNIFSGASRLFFTPKGTAENDSICFMRLMSSLWFYLHSRLRLRENEEVG